MKLSELDEMLCDRRDLVTMRTDLAIDHGPICMLPDCIKLLAKVDLYEKSKARLLDIDERLMQWGVEIDLPHEGEPDADEARNGE